MFVLFSNILQIFRCTVFFKSQINFSIHVRRTDKVGTEAAFHRIEEYMIHVEEYYNQLEMNEKVSKRRIYLASDDPKVYYMINNEFSTYHFC